MGTFSNWIKPFFWVKNHGFLSWQFCGESNLNQSGKDKIYNFPGVEPLSLWLVDIIIWTRGVKKKEKWQRTRAYRRENRNKTVKIRTNDPENYIRKFAILVGLCRVKVKVTCISHWHFRFQHQQLLLWLLSSTRTEVQYLEIVFCDFPILFNTIRETTICTLQTLTFESM